MCRAAPWTELKVGYVGEPVELRLPGDIQLLLRVIVEAEVDAASHPSETVGVLDGLGHSPLHLGRVERVKFVFRRAVVGEGNADGD